MNLLIVDDEIYAIQGILDRVDWGRLPYSVRLTANSYSQAINIFLSQHVDVLLCDIEMPHGSGIDLVTWVKGNSPSTECIFLTCHDEFDFARDAIRLQCLDYLLKPADKEALEVSLMKAAEVTERKKQNGMYQNFGKQYIENMKGQAGKSEDIVEKTERNIRDNISSPITVEELARQVHISTDHLTRLFKKKHGLTVIDYITSKRLVLAGELIKQGDMSISAVAMAVGYSDYSYFTRVFKKTFGCSPRDYRAKSSSPKNT